MKFRLSHFIQEIQFRLKKIIERYSFIRALTNTVNDKPQGFFSLAKIYEQGSSIMSADAAIAYALYCLSAQRGLQKATEKINILDSCLTYEDRRKAKQIIGSFSKSISDAPRDLSGSCQVSLNKNFNIKKRESFMRQWC